MTIHYRNRWGNKQGFAIGKQTLYFVISFDEHWQWFINVERVKLNSLDAIIMVRVSFFLIRKIQFWNLSFIEVFLEITRVWKQFYTVLAILRLALGLMSEQCMVTLSRILLECLWWIWVEILFNNGIEKGV